MLNAPEDIALNQVSSKLKSPTSLFKKWGYSTIFIISLLAKD